MSNPSGPSDTSPGTLELTWGRALKIWWSLMWRTVLAALLLGFLLGAVLGFVLSLAGVGMTAIVLLCQCAGAAVGILVGVAMVRHVLSRSTWSDFRIVLVAPQR